LELCEESAEEYRKQSNNKDLRRYEEGWEGKKFLEKSVQEKALKTKKMTIVDGIMSF
jgi:hypothetical protein